MLLLLNLRLLLLLLLLLLLVSPLTCISWHRTRNKLFSSHTQVGLFFWYKFICSNVPLCLLSSLIPLLLLLLLLPLLVILLIDCLLLIQTTLSWSSELVVAVLLLSWVLLSWMLLSGMLLSRLSLSATAISLLNFLTSSTTLIIPCQIVIPRRPTISIGS